MITFLDWFHGNDTTFVPLTVNVANEGLFLDQSLIDPDTKTIVISNEAASGIDYDYEIFLSRSVDNLDKYSVLTASNVSDVNHQVVLPDYDFFVQCVITPAVGQTGTQLNFKAYLAGQGG